MSRDETDEEQDTEEVDGEMPDKGKQVTSTEDKDDKEVDMQRAITHSLDNIASMATTTTKDQSPSEASSSQVQGPASQL